MSTPNRFRHAESAGAYHLPTTRPMKLTPAELPLTLTADVLRLPYPLATRVVLAEVISLHEATRGCCDCSDAHLAARLTISKDTVSVAIQLLVKDGLLVKTVDKAAGFYRTLTPVASLIQGKAQTNPYPEIPGRGATRNLPVPYPEIPAPPTRNLPDPLPGNSGTNTSSSNLPVEPSSKLSSAAHETATESEIGVELLVSPPVEEIVSTLNTQPQAPHTRGAAAARRPAASLNPNDYTLPEWATDEFKTEFVEWLTFRQGHRAGKLLATSIQKQLNELARYDAGYCSLLFAKALKSGYQGLTFDDTPAKYEVYKQNQHSPLNPAQHGNATTFPQQRPASGAKPTGAGALLARALAEQRAGVAHGGHYGTAAGSHPGHGPAEPTIIHLEPTGPR